MSYTSNINLTSGHNIQREIMRQEAIVFSYTVLFYYQDRHNAIKKRVMHCLSSKKSRGAYNYVVEEIKVMFHFLNKYTIKNNLRNICLKEA